MITSQIPNFLVIGPSKAGTTSLFHYLRQHPDIYLSPVKNPRFFYDDYEQVPCPGGGYTLDQYNSGVSSAGRMVTDLREYLRLFDDRGEQQAVGEISPGYLTYSNSSRLLAEFNPSLRLIAMLRDPVNRAFSNYTHLVAKNLEHRSFLQSLEEEPIDEPVGVLTDSTLFVREGLYHRNISRYLEYFDRDQLLICWFDEFVTDPSSTLRRIFSFLGVDLNATVSTETVHNVTTYARSKLLRYVLRAGARSVRTFVPQGIKSHLGRLGARLSEINSYTPVPLSRAERICAIDFFREDTERLQELLEVDLSEWMK